MELKRMRGGAPPVDESEAEGYDGEDPAGVAAGRAELNALLHATRRYARDDTGRSWFHLLSALLLVIAASVAAGIGMVPWPLRVAASIISGLTIVRLFIVFHDHMHGTVLRGSRAAGLLLRAFGWVVLTPGRVWRDTHRYHHSHTAKIEGSHIGSFEMATVDMWREMGTAERIRYRISRHPLLIMGGYFSVFLLGMCVFPFLRAPRKNWEAAASIVTHYAFAALLLALAGPAVVVLSFLLPCAIAMATGAYLFYAQHNVPEVFVQAAPGWDFGRAALESSSYLEMGSVMAWFTGNIGYHHVHHLNSKIPFYRLPEAMAAIPELQNPPRTSLALGDIAASFRCKLWDTDLQRMVGFPAR